MTNEPSTADGAGCARVIAIDGPAGAGKSTVARAVAQKLDYAYLDTGALYRSLALAALRRGVAAADEPALEALATSLDIRVHGDRILLDGEDVSDRIRAADVTAIVSEVSAHPGVRSRMVSLQRDAGRRGRVVMEGRDIGSAIAPDAGLKVFLTASLDERAARRARQLGTTTPQDVARLREEIGRRDELDAGRTASPLIKAPDSIEIDSTNLTFDEVVERIALLACERGP